MQSSFIKNVKESKECRVLFIKNAKERENVAFFWKERKRMQERCVLLKRMFAQPWCTLHKYRWTILTAAALLILAQYWLHAHSINTDELYLLLLHCWSLHSIDSKHTKEIQVNYTYCCCTVDPCTVLTLSTHHKYRWTLNTGELYLLLQHCWSLHSIDSMHTP